MVDTKEIFGIGTDNPIINIRFFLSDWCNFNCKYCTGHVNKKENSRHAFDFYTADEWLQAFKKIDVSFTLELTGGEPFLDNANFVKFLSGVTALDNCKVVRIDTNGSMINSAKIEKALLSKIFLNISYHPTQEQSLQTYELKIKSIQDYGWNISMINFVMEKTQKEEFETAQKLFRDVYGLYVNPNPDFQEIELEAQFIELSKYFPKRDIEYKTRISTKGKRCYFPLVGFRLWPNGKLVRFCTEEAEIDFIQNSGELKQHAREDAIICTQDCCVCLNMYSFIEEFTERGNNINLLEEYASACKLHIGWE